MPVAWRWSSPGCVISAIKCTKARAGTWAGIREHANTRVRARHWAPDTFFPLRAVSGRAAQAKMLSGRGDPIRVRGPRWPKAPINRTHSKRFAIEAGVAPNGAPAYGLRASSAPLFLGELTALKVTGSWVAPFRFHACVGTMNHYGRDGVPPSLIFGTTTRGPFHGSGRTRSPFAFA